MRTLVTATILAAASAVAAASAGELTVGRDARTALSVTAYPDGIASIHERHAVTVEKGANRLAFDGISREMLPASVVVRAQDARLSELVYDFNVLTPDTLLRRSVGSEVDVIRSNFKTGEETVETATVLAAEPGVVLRFKDRIETEVAGRLAFRSVPPDLRTRPTLVATLETASAGPRPIDLLYQARGLDWQADYVVELAASGDALDLTGRANLNNQTGVDFKDARLGLVAGRVNRAMPPAPAPRALRGSPKAEAVAATVLADDDMPVREALGDQQLYILPQPVTLADREMRQFPLLEAKGVPVRRDYVSEQSVQPFPASETELPSHPRIRLRFDNREGQAAGMPLPAGVARVFLRDKSGEIRLIGEDQLAAVPVGGTVTLSPGQAFDISVARKQTDFVKTGLPDRVFEAAYAITVRNAKDEPATVQVVEQIPGDWQMVKASQPHEQPRADRAVWTMEVKPKSTSELTFRVRVRS